MVRSGGRQKVVVFPPPEGQDCERGLWVAEVTLLLSPLTVQELGETACLAETTLVHVYRTGAESL